jgi:hypothetical protein
MKQTCPECGADWRDDVTCRDHFDQMLVWEFEDPGGAGAVHHLTVLCFYIQHPSLYAPDGLAQAKQILKAFVEDGVTPAEMRKRLRNKVDSGKRDWKISGGQPASHGRTIVWPLTIVDVAGLDGYAERVQQWARSVHETLKTATSAAGG